ncbi:DNA translocase FtsK [Candidatus Parcubacteria bacterium]|nr:MAG: DNA translocase FtsK [Candidatus Parcubacteria bacterium]
MAANGGKKSDREKSARSKKRDAKQSDTVAVPSISSGALRSVSAVFLLAIAVFLVLALIGTGGAIGASVYNLLFSLLGVGYLLLPLSFLFLAVIIFQSFEKKFGAIQIVSVSVFLIASLGLVNLMFPGRGGIVGGLISNPLVAGLDVAATAIFLTAFTIAALVIAFDVHLIELMQNAWKRMRSGSDAPIEEGADIEEASVTGLAVDEVEEADDEAPAEEAQEQVPAPVREQAPRVASFSDNENAGGFPIIAATGSTYNPPPISILAKNKGKPEVGDVKANMNIIKRTLQNFGIQVEMDEASIGPTVTRYAMKPAEGVRLSKIVALQSNLELALAASPVRIEAPIPGKSLVGIEVPNIARTTLGLAPLVGDEGFASSDKPLLIALGRSITGQPHYADLAKMPHLLVAGTTGAGKSVTIHDFVVSLLYRCGPERLRFIMVDPKRVELTLYNSIPHLLTPVITDPKKAILALKWLAKEMDRRYSILETERVRDIASYHENVVAPVLEKGIPEGTTPPEAMPYIVLIIDELADIMTTYPREMEAGIVRLAQMSRAVGIHLVLSTQRPSVKVITGLIKANIPARVALQVSSQIDSRTILDMGGAEKLLGAGDMLFLSGEMSKPRRIQASYISEAEVKKVVDHVAKEGAGQLVSEINFEDAAKAGGGSGPDAIFASMSDEEEEEDELYPQAKQTVMEAGKASTSYLQRKLGVGYARAARLMDLLEQRGVIGPADGAKPREVIHLGDDASARRVGGGAPGGARPADTADDGSVFDE